LRLDWLVYELPAGKAEAPLPGEFGLAHRLHVIPLMYQHVIVREAGFMLLAYEKEAQGRFALLTYSFQVLGYLTGYRLMSGEELLLWRQSLEFDGAGAAISDRLA
jgi:hypothetical protein